MYFQNIYYKHNSFLDQKNIIILKINIQTGGLDNSDTSRQAFHNQTRQKNNLNQILQIFTCFQA